MNRSLQTNGLRRHTLGDEIDIDDDDDDDDDIGVSSQHLIIERKAPVSTLLWLGLQYAVQTFTKKAPRSERQWSRSFAPQYQNEAFLNQQQQQHQQQQPPPLPQSHATNNLIQSGDLDFGGTEAFDNITPHLQENELFFDSCASITVNNLQNQQQQVQSQAQIQNQARLTAIAINGNASYRGARIASQLLDGVQDNSRRPIIKQLKLLHIHEMDDRYDHRPYFTCMAAKPELNGMALHIDGSFYLIQGG